MGHKKNKQKDTSNIYVTFIGRVNKLSKEPQILTKREAGFNAQSCLTWEATFDVEHLYNN